MYTTKLFGLVPVDPEDADSKIHVEVHEEVPREVPKEVRADDPTEGMRDMI